MTGQVKEDILSRFGELGLRVKEGRLCFDFTLLKEEPHQTRYSSFQCTRRAKIHYPRTRFFGIYVLSSPYYL